MNNQKILKWLDVFLLPLFFLTIVSFPANFHFAGFVHTFFGILLSAIAFLHLILHWNWIKKALPRMKDLTSTARRNLILDCCLGVTYLLCGFMGLTAQVVSWISFFVHLLPAVLHVLLSVTLIILQCLHIWWHRQWYGVMLNYSDRQDRGRPLPTQDLD